MLFRISGLPLALLYLFNSSAFAGQTTRVSVSATGVQSNGTVKSSPSISANGRYVAFVSNANNLIPGTKKYKKYNVYIHDRYKGSIEIIDVNKVGKKEYGDVVSSPSMSADGRYLAFAVTVEQTSTTTTVSGNTTTTSTITTYHPNVFTYDRVTKQLELMSIGLGGKYGNGSSGTENSVNISSDGRYVTFISDATDLVTGDTNETADVFVRDRIAKKTERVNVSSKGGQSEKYYSAEGMTTVSSNGRYIGFWSRAANLVPGDNGQTPDAFIYDRNTRKIERVNILPSGRLSQDYSPYKSLSISKNGRYAAFAGRDDSSFASHVFIRGLLTKKTQLLKKLTYGFSNSRIVFSGNALSGDGRYLTYTQGTDYYVYDRQADTVKKVGATLDDTGFSAVSANGRNIAFVSGAANLVAHDTNKTNDVFVYDQLLDAKHRANLQITPTTKPATLKPNTQGNYLYTITNNGKDAVPDVSLIYLVSGGSAFSFKPSQGKCSPSAVETVCHLGKLAAGKKLTLRVTVKAQSKAFSQQITVSGAPVDTKLGNNQVSVTTPVK